MIVLPDGANLEMSWKWVRYCNHDDYIDFQIIPMYGNRDVVIIPNVRNWEKISDVFPISEREEIILLLEMLNWKRKIRLVELDVPANANCKYSVLEGSLESTEAYKTMKKENLFDNDCVLDQEQVKSIYLSLEKRFAESLQGEINISIALLIDGSVMKEFIMPILEKNQNVKVNIVEK